MTDWSRAGLELDCLHFETSCRGCPRCRPERYHPPMTDADIKLIATRLTSATDRDVAALAHWALARMNDAVLARPVDIALTEPPGPTSQFVEVEDVEGRGVSVGEWRQRPDGKWALRVVVVQ